MKQENDYMDQLFKDHFENFSPSPSEQVWEGIAANTTMANGKRLGKGGYWKIGLWLSLVLMISLGVSQGAQWLGGADQSVSGEEGVSKPSIAKESNLSSFRGQFFRPIRTNGAEQAEAGLIIEPDLAYERPQGAGVDNINKEKVGEDSGAAPKPVEISPIYKFKYLTSVALQAMPEDHVGSSDELLMRTPLVFNESDRSWAVLNDPLSVKARRNLSRGLISDDYYKKKRGGHWFVSGHVVVDPQLGHNRSGEAFDGLAFGAGKYLTPNSFVEVSLRGAWANGFNMRATYARLLLPGKLRPYVQGGITWGDDVQFRAGAGLLYTPAKWSKWRFFVAANYESAFKAPEIGREGTGVIEIGTQIGLSGTEPVISDNNWMNSIPHYTLPGNWYVDASVNFSFETLTNVTHYSAYMGKYLEKRWFVRAGVRVTDEQISLPVQLQYHFLMRKKLRFGAYTGASLQTSPANLGVELGLIAYYEMLPNWSLYVAPVILENSDYTERLFEVGIQFKLPRRKY